MSKILVPKQTKANKALVKLYFKNYLNLKFVIYQHFSVDFTTVHVEGTGGRSAKNGVTCVKANKDK